jgi:hypothetical protein
MQPDRSELWTRLERLGEAEVRKRLAEGGYGARKRPLVEAWLQARESARSVSKEEREERARVQELKVAQQSVATGRWSNIISALSLLVALGALILSGLAFTASRREEVSIQVERSLAGLPSGLRPWANPLGAALVETWWQCLISNTGDRTASVVTAEVWGLRDGRALKWSDMIGRMMDTEGKPVILPITIQPGFTARIFVQINIPIDSFAFARLSSAFPTRVLPSLREAEELLVKHRRDFFGNALIPFLEGDSVRGFKVASLDKQPVLLFSFTTSRHRELSSAASWYPGSDVLGSRR